MTFTSPDTHNEVLELFSHSILRRMCKDINLNSTQFGLIVDGTHFQGIEQESIRVHHVTEDFDVREDFVGLYEVITTIGIAMAAMLLDALRRLQLPVHNVRAQTYDGAANMPVKYHGCQAELKRIQPLVKYAHRGAHISHIIPPPNLCKNVSTR